MRRLFLIAFTLAVPLAVSAQEVEPRPLLGYGFFGSGAAFTNGESSSMLLHTGGGLEHQIYKGLGASTEVGYLFPREAATEGFGILSTNGSYHFPAAGKVVPFVTGGYSMAFRNSTANLFNFGGGVDVWTSDRVGLRFEARDHVWPERFGGSATHFLMFRVAAVIR